MERSGVTPQVAADASDLVDLAKAVGPFLSLQLTTESGIDNAAQRSEQRWRSIRDEAAGQGAGEEVLAAVDPLVADAHLHGDGLAVIASAGGVLHVEHVAQAPERDLARWAPLPALLPVVAWRQASPAYVTVRFGPEPTQLGTTPAEVKALGVEEATEGRLVDVAVRAALGTGAGIRVVGAGAGLEGGIGAILRWST